MSRAAMQHTTCMVDYRKEDANLIACLEREGTMRRIGTIEETNDLFDSMVRLLPRKSEAEEICFHHDQQQLKLLGNNRSYIWLCSRTHTWLSSPHWLVDPACAIVKEALAGELVVGAKAYIIEVRHSYQNKLCGRIRELNISAALQAVKKYPNKREGA